MITWQKVRVIQLSSVRKSRGSLSSHFFADIWFLLRNGVQTGPPYFEKVWRPIPNTSTFSIPREASPRTLFFWLYIIQYSYHHHQRCRQQTYKRPNQSLIWPTVSFEMSWTYPASAASIPDFLPWQHTFFFICDQPGILYLNVIDIFLSKQRILLPYLK